MTARRSQLARTAWLVVALLWPVALLNYLDRQMLAAMKGSVTGDIPTIASDEHWGMLLASFKWVYAFLSPVGGMIADRYSKRGIIIGSLFVWSAVTWLTGHCETYHQMLATRALMGISEAFYIPAALALIADFHTGSTRSRAVAIHQIGIYIGIMIGGYTGYVAESPDYGWRWAFTVAGIVGMAYSVPMALLLPGSPQTSTGESTHRFSLIDVRELCRSRNFILLVLCFTLPAMAGWVVRDWMPAILKNLLKDADGVQISQGKAGETATLWVSLAMLGGAFLGGWLADRWMQTQIRGRTFVSAIGISLLIPSLFAISHAETVPIAALILIVFGIGWGFFDCNNMPILCQIARPQLRATGYGLMNMISISFGGLADWSFGRLRDQGVPLPLIFGTFAAVALVSVVLMLMIRPQSELIAGAEGE